LYPFGLLHSAGPRYAYLNLLCRVTSESRRWDLYVCSALGVRSQAGLRRTVPESAWPRRGLGQIVPERRELPRDSIIARSRASRNVSDFGFLGLAAGVRNIHGIACR